ncbi:MAG TPA: FtsX-like permease family protein [Polyangiaceae bacterium]|jgi:ABC-type lipoprotein release transport system permease subunit
MSAFFLDIRIAFLSLIEHRRRAAFLGIAIAAVTALLVILNGLAAGIRGTLIDTALTLSTGHLNVGGFYKVTSGQAGMVVTEYKKVEDAVKRDLPEADFMVERGRGWGKLVSDTGSMQAAVSGIDIERESAFKGVLRVESGNIDELAQPKTILIFDAQAKKLKLKVGDALTISAQTTRGVANTIDCRVVAIAEDVGLLSQWNVFVSNESLRTLYQLRSDVAGVIQIHLKPQYQNDLAPLAARLRLALEHDGYRVMEADSRAFWMKIQDVTREEWTGQKLDVTTWEDELSFMMWTLQAFNGLSLVLMVILVAIMVTGIMNTMWIAIRERTREIGTLRAIGMQRGGVLRMFLWESLLLGLLGGSAGAVLGFGLAALLNASKIHVPLSVQLFLMSDTVRVAVLLPALLGAIALISVVTGLAALYPALRAARLKPVDAMSHFG